MRHHRAVPGLIWLFISLFCATSALFSAEDSDAIKVQRLFTEFTAALKPADLAVGTCVQNASRFYEKLLDAHVDTTKARLVLVVREPNRGMPQPMYPDATHLRGEKPSFWIWHAFVTYNGTVFDANYRHSGHSLATYFRNFWGKDPNRDSFWVFAVQYQDLPKIAGSAYPGGPPRMLRYKPISPDAFSQDPLHLTVPRK